MPSTVTGQDVDPDEPPLEPPDGLHVVVVVVGRGVGFQPKKERSFRISDD